MSQKDHDTFAKLAEAIASPLPGVVGGFRPLLEQLFGGRYQARHKTDYQPRDAYALGNDPEGEGVPYAGLIHPDNPTSGPYGGTSLVWFPTKEDGTLIGFGVGTRGLSPDEGILTRAGHRRRIAALRKYLARLGVEVWSKPDPSALSLEVPKSTRERFPGFDHVFKRYGREMYCNALIPKNKDTAYRVVQAFFDLYAYERGWKVLKDGEKEFIEFHSALRSDLFPSVNAESVHALLKQRRFVVLQGPPGTGKTRLAQTVKRNFYKDRGMTVQFHPAVTYEDFIVGLSPDPRGSSLKFDVRPGWLLQAAKEAKEGPYLLTIDEVNRADLGKVLGEAVYLFEPDEIGSEYPREIRLPHAVDGGPMFRYPENLYVLATMNTADRSIASMDLAIRRRFAFVNMLPERDVVAKQGHHFAIEVFDRIADVFVEHVAEDNFDLMPGHAYFLAKTETDLKKRFQYELIPLLDEYLRQGALGAASSELYAVRDWILDSLTIGDA